MGNFLPKLLQSSESCETEPRPYVFWFLGFFFLPLLALPVRRPDCFVFVLIVGCHAGSSLLLVYRVVVKEWWRKLEERTRSALILHFSVFFLVGFWWFAKVGQRSNCSLVEEHLEQVFGEEKQQSKE